MSGNNKEVTEESVETNELQDFESGLDKIIEKNIPVSEKEDKQEEKKDDLPPEESSSSSGDEEGGKSPDKEEEKKEVEKEEISDDLLGRAVRAGLDLADAKGFKDASSLERMCSLLESKSSKETEVKSEKEETDDSEITELFKDIPELSSEGDDGYDEGIVKVVNGLKSIIENQHKQLKAQGSLIEGLKSSSAKDPIVSGFNALPEEQRSLVSNDDMTSVQKKFNVLEAGYKASGEDVSSETVFNEALSMVCGDLKAKADAKSGKKEEALSKREKIATNPPSKDSRSKKDQMSATESAAQELKDAFPGI